MFNQNWPRWIVASVRKHFYDNRQGLFMHIEETDRQTASVSDFCEFRIDGPRIKEVSKDYFKLLTTVNILITSAMDNKDFDKINKNIGIIVAAFTPNINAFKYGDGPDDDSSFLGCMQLSRGKNDVLRVNKFGQIDKTEKINQATVEGRYYLDLTI